MSTPSSPASLARLERGALVLHSGERAAVHLHWTLPLGVAALSGFHLAPWLWVGALGLLTAHTLGHLALARRGGAKVSAVHLTGYGGHATWSGPVSELHRASTATGGVLAQGAVMLALLLALALLPSSFGFARATLSQLATANAWLMALNLLPIPPLDGWEAWPLPLRLLERALHRAEVQKIRAKIDERRALPSDLPALTPPTRAPSQRPPDDDLGPDPADEPPPEVVALVDRILEEARRDRKREKS